jgi:hypothetical protein
MSSVELWLLLMGSTAWLPVVLGTWVVLGGANVSAFLWLSIPYVGLVTALLASADPKTPASVWSGYFRIALGAYSLYLWLLLELWRQRERDSIPHTPPTYWLVVLGVFLAAVGWGSLWQTRRARANRQPTSPP